MLKSNIYILNALTPCDSWITDSWAALETSIFAVIAYQGEMKCYMELINQPLQNSLVFTYQSQKTTSVSLSRIIWETNMKILRKQSSLSYAQRRKVQNINLITNQRGIWVFRLHLKISQKIHWTLETCMPVVHHFRSISLWNDSACPQKAIAPSAAHWWQLRVPTCNFYSLGRCLIRHVPTSQPQVTRDWWIFLHLLHYSAHITEKWLVLCPP